MSELGSTGGSTTLNLDGKRVRTSKRRFLVKTDALTHTDEDILASSSVPQLTSLHPGTIFLSVRGVNVSRTEDNPQNWFVDVDYSSELPDPEKRDEESPVGKVWRRWRTVRSTRLLVRDLDGDLVVNSAADPFDPPIEVPRSMLQLVYVRNESTFDGATLLNFVNRVNDGTWNGGAAGTVMLADVSSDERFDDNQHYWQVTYTFDYDPDGHQPKILDAGYYQLSGGDSVRIKDKDGHDCAVPWPLDGAGVKVARSSLPDSVVYRNFKAHKTADFTELGLPER